MHVVKAAKLAHHATSLRCLPEGRPSPVLREVQLELVDPAKCRHVLQTVRGFVLNHKPSRSQTMTVLCAGPERGGKDACQVEKVPIYLSIYPSVSVCLSVCPSVTHPSIHLPSCRETQGVHWCARQGQVAATGWRWVLRPGVKDAVEVGGTTAAGILPREDPPVCSPMSGSCCPGSSKDCETVGPG